MITCLACCLIVFPRSIVWCSDECCSSPITEGSSSDRNSRSFDNASSSLVVSLPDKMALNLSCMCFVWERKERKKSALFAVKLSLSSLPFVVKTVKDREVL